MKSKPAPGKEQFFATRMGVYYPSQHVVLAIADAEVAETLADELRSAGFPDGDLYTAAPQEMEDFLEQTFADAGALAQIVGSELKQAEILAQLADTGCGFLIVRIPDETARDRLLTIGARHPLRKALYYHALAIEELPIAEDAIPGSSPYGVNEIPRHGGNE
ncbi:MAG: hypothetical protein ACLGHY_08245 [Gammaproteobacteria bacterium]